MDETSQGQAATSQAPSAETQPAQKADTQAVPPVQGDGAGAEQPGEATADWRKVIDDVDSKELRTHPKLSGLIGEMAKRQAQELADAQLANDQAQREARELAELRRRNPVEYAERMEAKEQAQVTDQQRWNQFVLGLRHRIDELPEDAKDGLLGRRYAGMTLAQAQAKFADDLLTVEGGSRTKKAVDEARKDAVEAGKAEARAEAAQGQRSPDLSTGRAIADLTQAEWDKNRSSAEWRGQNKERINRALTHRSITR